MVLEMEKVYFVGAGPGDPELLTLKGLKLLKEADVVVYTGSLIDTSILNFAKSNVETHDSAVLNLDQIVKLITKAIAQGKRVVRLCSGDPSLYGAIQEQIDLLKQHGIECEVIPGVSSFLAAAACLKRELTLPGISQTVIITRPEGRTPIPKSESLRRLAGHEVTMVIFLGIQHIRKLCKELVEGGYRTETPVAVMYRVTWPEEAIVRGTIGDIAEKVEKSGLSKTAIVIVGRILSDTGYDRSKLYDPLFTHGHRKCATAHCMKEAPQ
jgi:precorrin-4/cobalt-precorrin-4 C11-methyltransferase